MGSDFAGDDARRRRQKRAKMLVDPVHGKCVELLAVRAVGEEAGRGEHAIPGVDARVLAETLGVADEGHEDLLVLRQDLGYGALVGLVLTNGLIHDDLQGSIQQDRRVHRF